MPSPTPRNYLREYVPEPKPAPCACPAVDVYSPTQAMLELCHALRVTLDTLDVVLAGEEPDTMANLCGREIRDALRIMNTLELHGTREGERVTVTDSHAWFDWRAMPPMPDGWAEVN